MAKLADVARKIEAEAASKRPRATVDLQLPVYDGRYAARFGVLPPDDLEAFEEALLKLARREDVEPREGYVFGAGFVAQACRAILGRSDKAGPWEPLTHDDGRPVRFDEDLASALGLTGADGHDIDSAAECVLAMWVTESLDDEADQFNGAAFTDFTERLLRWMRDTTKPVLGEVVGGLPGGAR